ncbi:alpha/beta-type small acid-soluble spore protein [Desmospora activa]|uniref:Small acid-soluble spore protein alpha/beta type n=1 Tax=Desmospora activa DSM 45169 TaxID=1121389 RepID=A0A2T4ZDQ9_9BACL|nr:alpha/beta-type small acid-soluble spore protein [Desmospora activa]PTM60025.1 small acid-soluble spore protein alpha/beta type [Desmospora activa DSM 45169]
MARRRRNRLLVPEARDAMNQLKQQVMARQTDDPGASTEEMKSEMADRLGVPYREDGKNGDLKAEEAGRLGGPIGGQMVKEMIRMAQEELANKSR